MSFKDHFQNLLNERSVTAMFNAPENQGENILIHNILDNLQKQGGLVLGQGAYGTALTHPDWNYIAKVFYGNDPCYLRYIRFCAKHQGNFSAIPVLKGTPQKITPHFSRVVRHENVYVVRLEKLYPMSEEDSKQFFKLAVSGYYKYLRDKYAGEEISTIRYESVLEILERLETYPKFKPLFQLLDYMARENVIPHSCSIDMHDGNFMVRENGEIVMIDPTSSHSESLMDELKAPHVYARNSKVVEKLKDERGSVRLKPRETSKDVLKGRTPKPQSPQN